MITYNQLEKKLHRVCIGSGLSDDEMIRALTATLVGIVISSTGDPQRWKQMAKAAVYDILEGVSINTQEAKALGAELFLWMTEVRVNAERAQEVQEANNG